MTATISPAVASVPRTAVLLVAGAAVAGLATTVIALAARAAGADPGFAPLNPPVYLAFVVLGLLGAYLGWRIVRRVAPNPRAVLRVLVPVAVVLSFVPDVMLAILRFIPGTTITGVVALALMHLVVAGVAVPLSAKLAPVR